MSKIDERTALAIVTDVQQAILGAIEELGKRRDIPMETVQAAASHLLPNIAVLFVQAVGSRRALNDAKVQASGADLSAHGPTNIVPTVKARVPKFV